jgi:uncharacterized protein YjcR
MLISSRFFDPVPKARVRHLMKKLFLVVLATLILSGCSWNKVKKWIDEMEWERDDQTVRIVDIFFK